MITIKNNSLLISYLTCSVTEIKERKQNQMMNRKCYALFSIFKNDKFKCISINNLQ